MTLEAQLRFRLAALMTIASALLVGYFHVGSFYLFGLPVVPLVISLLILWTTKTSILKKASATILAVLSIPAGFLMWAWWNDVTLHWKW